MNFDAVWPRENLWFTLETRIHESQLLQVSVHWSSRAAFQWKSYYGRTVKGSLRGICNVRHHLAKDRGQTSARDLCSRDDARSGLNFLTDWFPIVTVQLTDRYAARYTNWSRCRDYLRHCRSHTRDRFGSFAQSLCPHLKSTNGPPGTASLVSASVAVGSWF